MEHILTLVAPTALTDDTINGFRAMASASGAGEAIRLGDRAADIPSDLPMTALADLVTKAHAAGLDAAAMPAEGRRKHVLICDMDSTIIEQECLDELAEVAGCGAEIKAVTERAMRGELDFEDALRGRVAKLKGLAATTIEEVLRDRITLSPGAQTLAQTMATMGATTALVSGGFTRFTEAVAGKTGFATHRGNVLEIDDTGHLTGQVLPPILGREAKRDALEALCRDRSLVPSDAVAIGDGANDLAMIERSGLGVAYRAKPVVAAAAAAAIHHTDLTAALYFQGIAARDFA